MDQPPMVGEIVHYRINNELVMAAVIVWVYEHGSVNLTVFGTDGIPMPKLDIKQGDGFFQWNRPSHEQTKKRSNL